MRILFYIFVLNLFSAHLLSQDHCVFSPIFRSTELIPAPLTSLGAATYFCIHEDTLETIDGRYAITETIVKPFEEKDDLLRYFGCVDDFYYSHESIVGELIEYHLETSPPNVGDKLTFIYFDDTGDLDYYALLDVGFYKMSNSTFYYPDEIRVLEPQAPDTSILSFVYEVNDSVTFEISEPVYEEISETILVHDAYTEMEIIQPEFITEYQLVNNESSSCAEAIYDTSFVTIEAIPSYETLEAVPAVFEIITEQVLTVAGYGAANYYERSKSDSTNVIIRGEYDLVQFEDIDPQCRTLFFTECLELDVDIFPSIDTVFYNVYPKCEEGFQAAGKYCFNNDDIVPHEYSTRVYEKLITPASTTPIVVASEFIFVPQISILNKSELDEDCWQVTTDSIPIQKLNIPATILINEVPAEYTTRTWMAYKSGGTFDPSETSIEESKDFLSITGGGYKIKDKVIEKPSRVTRCHFVSIAKQLIDIGYLPEGKEYDYYEFYKSVVQYQIDNNLDVGVIDERFIVHLNVKFGY